MESLQLYPATIPLLILFGAAAVQARFRFDKGDVVLKSLYLLAGGTVGISYLIKLSN